MGTNEERKMPIGFIDSGLGGISVLKEAIKLLPHEDFIYFGDSLNAPYGTKSVEQIRTLTFNIVDKLLKLGIKGLVVACNTATSAAVRQLRIMYPDLTIVGIEPAIKPAVESNHGGDILVLATPMTIKQEKFNLLLNRYNNQANIIPIACKGLMEFVEQGNLNGKFLEDYFNEHLVPYLNDKTETIVLGCTHYPFLRPYLKEFLDNKQIQIIDGSNGTSRELKRQLVNKDLLQDDNHIGKVIIKNSLNDSKIIDLSWKLLNLPID